MSADVIAEFQAQYRFLSNFWMVPIEVDGTVWPSVEHAYQGLKTADLVWQARIRACKTPGQAKRFGREVPRRADCTGEMGRVELMLRLVRIKFTYNATMRRQLLETGQAELIEGNSWGDTFWGVCNGVGRNHLGRILMQVRAELISDPSGTSL